MNVIWDGPYNRLLEIEWKKKRYYNTIVYNIVYVILSGRTTYITNAIDRTNVVVSVLFFPRHVKFGSFIV